MDGIIEKVKKYKVDCIHGIQEHSWGQRGLRFYDPDKHIIEVSETMTSMVKRMRSNGMSVAEITKKTGLSEKMVDQFSKKEV